VVVQHSRATTVDSDRMSETEELPPEGEEPAPKKAPKGVVLIGALVGALVIGAAAGLLAVGPQIAKRSGFIIKPHAAGDSASAEGDSTSGAGHSGGSGKEGEAATSNVHLIDNLVLNPAGSGGSRFLMLAAAVEFNDPTMIEEIKLRDSEARDVVLRVLGSRTVEELADPASREPLKLAVADSLGTLFKKKKVIRRVYFPQFVIQ
jgi:flagellar FliL protein